MADGQTQDRTRKEGYAGARRERMTIGGEAQPAELVGGEAPTGRSGRDDRSLGQLIRELGDESGRLLREEVALAKAELREKAAVYERNAVKMAIGGVLLLGALAILLVAVNRGLTALLEQWMALEIAVWLAPLILAAVFGLIGWSMLKGARQAMKREGLTPHRTVDTIREEKDWMKREAKEVRHGER